MAKVIDQAARQCEKALGALGGVMALEGEAHLHHAPAQQDEAHRPDEGKDESRSEIAHHGQRVPCQRWQRR